MDVHSKIGRFSAYAIVIIGVLLGLYSTLSRMLQGTALSTTFQLISPEVQLSIFLTLISALLLYLMKIVEQVRAKVDSLELSSHSTAPIIYQNQKEFFEALLEHSLKSDKIYTHMLSVPPQELGKYATAYFTGVHNALKKNKFSVFHRIATIHSEKKARWVLETILELKDSDSYSLAIQYVKGTYPQPSIHLALGNSVNEVFVWAAMGSGGFGRGFLINDIEVAEVMKQEHEREFHNSIVLKAGSVLHWDKLHNLAEEYKLIESECYKQLMDFKTRSGT
ncbi:MAG TPA: hypothetical protein VN256_20245 [Pyrinomonadaceae bacterium]|nr:hypothetical protein [Pyrinomonadaceae bacterium]